MNDSKLLMVFMDVVDQGSFAKAARHRDTDPGQITKQIKALESQLGTVLLNRSTRSMSLTEVGEKVYAKARQVKKLMEEIGEIPSDYLQKVQGVVRVTSPVFLGRKFVEPSICAVKHLYPDVMFDLEISDGHTDIIKEGFDVAIRQWAPKDSNLIATKLRDAQLMLVASPAFIGKYGEPESAEDLQRLPAALYHRKNLTRDKLLYFNDEKELVTLQLNGGFMVNDAELILRSTLKGSVFSLVNDYMVKEYLASGELVQLLPELSFPPEHSVYAVTPHRSATKGTRLFIEELKKELSMRA